MRALTIYTASRATSLTLTDTIGHTYLSVKYLGTKPKPGDFSPCGTKNVQNNCSPLNGLHEPPTPTHPFNSTSTMRLKPLQTAFKDT